MLTCKNITLLTERFTVSIIQTLFTVDVNSPYGLRCADTTCHQASHRCSLTKASAYPATCASLQLLAALRFLVQSAPVTLHHVDEVGKRLFLIHRYVPEVSAHSLHRRKDQSPLSYVHTRALHPTLCKEGTGAASGSDCLAFRLVKELQNVAVPLLQGLAALLLGYQKCTTEAQDTTKEQTEIYFSNS